MASSAAPRVRFTKRRMIRPVIGAATTTKEASTGSMMKITTAAPTTVRTFWV